MRRWRSIPSYTVTVRGGATDPRVKDAAGNALAANDTWSLHHHGRLGDHAQHLAEHRHAGDGFRFGNRVRRARRQVPHRRGRLQSRACASTRARPTPAPTSATCGRPPARCSATCTFVNETATRLAAGAVRRRRSRSHANTTYVASYFAPNGGYSIDGNYFATSGVDNGVLHALSDPAGGGNGVYVVRPERRLPDQHVRRDQLLGRRGVRRHVIGPDTTPPTVTHAFARERRDQRRDQRRRHGDVQRGDGRHHHQQPRPSSCATPATRWSRPR